MTQSLISTAEHRALPHDSLQRSEFPSSIFDSVQRIDPVTIYGRRYREVIPPQRIEGKALGRLNSLTVADAIRYFAGVQLKDYGGVGGLKTVNIRSMGTHHTAVFYDGFALDNAQNGQVDLGKFSLDNLESLSLYNGQKSDIFQTARDYASAGSIYLQTHQPIFQPGKNLHIKGTFRTGSFGLVNPAVRLEYAPNERISATASTEIVHAHGRYKFRYYRRNSDGSTAYDTIAVRHNGDVNAVRAEAALYGSHRWGGWRLSGYHYSSERGIPGAIVSNVWRRGERLWDRNTFVQGSLRVDLSSRWHMMGKARYAYDYTRYMNNDVRMLRTHSSYRQQEAYAAIVALYNLLPPWWDVSLAYDFKWNSLLAWDEYNNVEPYHFPYPSRLTHYLALATTVEIWRFSIQASLLETLVQNRVKQYQGAPDRYACSPALFVSYQPIPDLGLSLRAFYKHSFRLPSFNDLYYSDLGNTDLRPERVTQTNGGIRYQLLRPRNLILNALTLSLDGYFNRVKDKIVALPKGEQFRWTMVNLGYVEIWGFDCSGGLSLSPWPEANLSLLLQYSYQRAQDLTDPRDRFYGHQIVYTPRHSGSAIVNLGWRGWGLNYSFIYAGGRYFTSENIRKYYMQPWYTSDISLQYDFAISDYRFRLLLEVNNLLGQDFEVIVNYPMPKRNYRFSLAVQM